ncbi:MAG: glycerol-3-phosphate dehydrogenase [Candidatus Binatia bacterium]|nr:MAG: glycerol-3-phosphate dehydrogenase [Candidatus Binatia bacterium]
MSSAGTGRSFVKTPESREGSLSRENLLARLRGGEFDLLVVGGGINGAGIARDAALRGLRVALVEKGDFASGTSSKSSKLVHGGLRYLERFEFRLVRSACRERDRLRKLAPHLVRPLAFVFPVYRGDPIGLFRLELGMLAYDFLSAFRNIRAHRPLGVRSLLALEPGLRAEGLRGGALYYDAWTDDARLVLETTLSAIEHGAVAVNYVALEGFLKEGPKIVGARLRDRVSGQVFDVSARVVVNATGPWLDWIRRLDDPRAEPVLRLSKGVHVVLPRERVGNKNAVVIRSPRDGRIVFVLPWEGATLVGTTDTYFEGSPDSVSVDADDVEYLLEAVRAYFPGAQVGPEDVLSSFAGLRPLVKPEKELDPSAVSREEKIFESSSGLVSLGGGKLTTFRLVAQEVVDLALRRLGRGRASSVSARVPLPGGKEPPESVREELAEHNSVLELSLLEHLASRYGTRARNVLAFVNGNPRLLSPLVKGRPETLAEALFHHAEELAMTSEDILERRTRLGLLAPSGACRLRELLKSEISDLWEEK